MENNGDKNLTHININCDKPIYINTHANRWKYWIFNIEIFTFFNKYNLNR